MLRTLPRLLLRKSLIIGARNNPPRSSLAQEREMATQKLIANFFKPVNKRVTGERDDTQVAKKPKICNEKENEENANAPDSPTRSSVPVSNTCLSPEQKERMQKNKLKAEIKQASRKFVALHENIGPSWFTALKSEFSKPYFEKLSSFLEGERKRSTIFPPAEQVYSWTHNCELRDVKVVILGQDPYHGPRQAHGLCFSVQKGVPPPPSLLNMYKELEADIEGFQRPSHGHLIGWAQQGVLLLNACLTVRAHNANSHKDQGWEKFTDAVIKAVSDRNKGVVFLLWGSYAQKKAAVVDKKKHHLLNTTHPSPLSAHRGFLGCKHFSKCNEILKKEGKKTIDWKYLPLEI
ncbi:uracil-DNA glycosylase-like [Penaeus japonicus]|uniref:uracil-DNA glycosylase-like n=1 Tax=Penaeus japonicus TaxID=27405 RepID=UPI001C71046B|nr:uracil-DNA glycosylase-like [Penaeus japonicus]